MNNNSERFNDRLVKFTNRLQKVTGSPASVKSTESDMDNETKSKSNNIEKESVINKRVINTNAVTQKRRPNIDTDKDYPIKNNKIIKLKEDSIEDKKEPENNYIIMDQLTDDTFNEKISIYHADHVLEKQDTEQEVDYSNFDITINSRIDIFIPPKPVPALISLFYEAYAFCLNNNLNMPPWYNPENLCDSKGIKPWEPNYDISTVFIPEVAYNENINLFTKKDRDTYKDQLDKINKHHLTPALRQLWAIKRNRFDQIIFFKIGKFYELFYFDAYLGNRFLGLNWMTGRQEPHVGFPEAARDGKAADFIKHGFKVCIVEQTQRAEFAGNEKVIREVCDGFTPGLPPGHVDCSLLVALRDYDDVIYCILRIAEATATLRKVSISGFFTELSSMDIAEFICDRASWSKDELIAVNQRGTVIQDFSILRKPVSSACTEFLRKFGLKFFDTVKAAVGLIQYLDSLGVVRRVLPSLLFQIDDSPELFINDSEDYKIDKVDNLLDSVQYTEMNQETIDEIDPWMQKALEVTDLVSDSGVKVPLFIGDIPKCRNIDNPAILPRATTAALELFFTSMGNSTNSLFHYLNSCKTPAGSRVLRKWLSFPLTNKKEINSRLDCVEALIRNSDFSEEVSKHLISCSEFEKSLRGLEKLAAEGERKAVLYENVWDTKVKLLKHFLNQAENVSKLLKLIFDHSDLSNKDCREAFATQLWLENSSQTITGFISQLKPNIWNLFILNSQSEPVCIQNGVYKPYDDSLAAVNDIHDKLNKELERLKNIIHKSYPEQSSSINFVHTKFQYEINIPNNIASTMSKELDIKLITSQTNDFTRIRTDLSDQLVRELDIVSNAKTDILYPFLSAIAQGILKSSELFRILIQLIAEIDVLVAFSNMAKIRVGDGTMSRPKFIDTSHFARIVQGRHPVAEQTVNNYVPTTLELGESIIGSSCLLLSGPNMGGKSTLLRMVQTISILAQIGCFVPAKEVELSIFDGYYTRMGARDKIFLGKSTFMVEMEEVSNIFKYATYNSLICIDELGRGTATHDGTALAIASLEHCLNKKLGIIIFTTHYSTLLDAFANDTRVTRKYVKYEVPDKNSYGIQFLYALSEGVSKSSEATKVAVLAGLPDNVIKLAEEKTIEFIKGIYT